MGINYHMTVKLLDTALKDIGKTNLSLIHIFDILIRVQLNLLCIFNLWRNYPPYVTNCIHIPSSLETFTYE